MPIGFAGGAVLAAVVLLALALAEPDAGPIQPQSPEIADEETIRRLNEIAPAAGPASE